MVVQIKLLVVVVLASQDDESEPALYFAQIVWIPCYAQIYHRAIWESNQQNAESASRANIRGNRSTHKFNYEVLCPTERSNTSFLRDKLGEDKSRVLEQ